MTGVVQSAAWWFLLAAAPLIVGVFAARHSMVVQKRRVWVSLGLGAASAFATLLLLVVSAFVLTFVATQL